MPVTPKQKLFATKIASGLSQSQAYREAYSSSGNSGTVRTEASRLAGRPEISREIERLRPRLLLNQLNRHMKELGYVRK